MQYQYNATLTPDEEGGFNVTFPDVPEAITAGDTEAEALANARDALGVALRGILYLGGEIPVPKASGRPVAVDAEDALKIAVITAFKQAGISKVELAARLGKAETEARRILDPNHPSKLGQLQSALAALGKEVVVEVRDAA